MSDLTVTKQFEGRPRGGQQRLPIADAVVLPYGSLVGAEAGYANHWAGGVNDLFMGIVGGGDDRARDGVFTGETSDTPLPHVRIDTSGTTLIGLDSVGDSPTQAKVGNQIYCSTSNTDDMTLDPAGEGIIQPIGYMNEWRTSVDLDVTLYTPTEYLANRGNTYMLSIPIALDTVTAADTVTNLAIAHRFKLIDFQWIQDLAGTGSSSTLIFTLEIGATATTGGALTLALADTTPRGKVTAATAITALNVGAAADTLTVVAGTVTDYTAGTGSLQITIQDLGI